MLKTAISSVQSYDIGGNRNVESAGIQVESQLATNAAAADRTISGRGGLPLPGSHPPVDSRTRSAAQGHEARVQPPVRKPLPNVSQSDVLLSASLPFRRRLHVQSHEFDEPLGQTHVLRTTRRPATRVPILVHLANCRLRCFRNFNRNHFCSIRTLSDKIKKIQFSLFSFGIKMAQVCPLQIIFFLFSLAEKKEKLPKIPEVKVTGSSVTKWIGELAPEVLPSTGLRGGYLFRTFAR
jgi:hypothetical protein